MKVKIVLIIAAVLLLSALFLIRRQPAEQSLGGDGEFNVVSTNTTAHAASSPLTDIGKAVDYALPKRAESPADKQDAFRTIFSTPLALYGIVVDQDGQPVGDARVKIGVADKPWDSGSSYERVTGSTGMFEITGVRGAGINVEVAKEGYYAGRESRRLLQSGEMPSRDSPAVWRLYKKGTVETLIHHGPSWTDLPMDETPVEYDFNTKKFVDAGLGQIRAEVRVEGSMHRRFSWSYRLSVPSGGLIPRMHEFDFVAPEQGYAEVLEARIDANAANWMGAFNGDYFIRLPNGSYGRLRFSIARGRDNFSFRIDHAVVNPAGSRNLEYDQKSAPFLGDRAP